MWSTSPAGKGANTLLWLADGSERVRYASTSDLGSKDRGTPCGKPCVEVYGSVSIRPWLLGGKGSSEPGRRGREYDTTVRAHRCPLQHRGPLAWSGKGAASTPQGRAARIPRRGGSTRDGSWGPTPNSLPAGLGASASAESRPGGRCCPVRGRRGRSYAAGWRGSAGNRWGLHYRAGGYLRFLARAKIPRSCTSTVVWICVPPSITPLASSTRWVLLTCWGSMARRRSSPRWGPVSR